MDARGRRRRNWIIIWLAVVGISIVVYVGIPVVLFVAARVFSELGR